MALVTCFDDLADLVLIEVFAYLSSYDILWGLTHLNHRLAMLITEQGFFSRINLSLARYHQFNRILNFLPLNHIQSLSIDSDASPFQLTHWPYLPHLKTLRIIGVYNYDDFSVFVLLHAATLTHLIIKSNERMVPDGFSMTFDYPPGDMVVLINNVLRIQLPALQSLDLGMNYYGTTWPITTAVAPLTYVRLSLSNMDNALCLISTEPLSNTLRQLHITVGNSRFNTHCPVSMYNLSIRMINLHTFSLVQTFFSMLTIEWAVFEILTSSSVMPVLRRANVSLFININDINRIGSSGIFTDHRHVDVHFAFHLLNCPQYIKVTPYIPRGNRFHSREIVGATLVVNHWSDRSEWLIDSDPFSRGRQYYHHMWYTLPWPFDEFFHEYVPYKWITKVQVFEIPSKTMTTMDQSSLRSLDASGRTLSSPICTLPYVALSDCVQTYHLSFYNEPIRIYFSGLRNITLVNSINCLNNSSSFPPTIRSIRIILFYAYPNYMVPNWPVILHSLKKLCQLSSLRVFMYDLPKPADDESCEIIAKGTSLFRDFGFYFRRKFDSSDDKIETTFEDHTKFIRQLCHRILQLSFDKPPYYSIEDDNCGLTMWF
ncbi:unnamed protein product [Rotaria magnacalcarata]|uniref:F-box domain-containing protein n=3 Tax=Rotaria magnacalcarata TaxID=392030 RepID=A0A814H2K4_9BILA|nr:unnamed protein product [Rotaria magnacalcarata]